MHASEMALHEAVLARLNWQPLFLMFVFLVGDTNASGRLRRTLETLLDQVYTRWRVLVIPAHPGVVRTGVPEVLRAFPEISDRVEFVAEAAGRKFAAFAQADATDSDPPGSPLGGPAWIGILQAGDQLGCDALLRFALETGLDRGADLLYSDERCWNGTERRIEAFFKPGWSPARSSSVRTHFALFQKYRWGTTMRTGPPWTGSISSPS